VEKQMAVRRGAVNGRSRSRRRQQEQTAGEGGGAVDTVAGGGAEHYFKFSVLRGEAPGHVGRLTVKFFNCNSAKNYFSKKSF
jgi:hypothetical protein